MNPVLPNWLRQLFPPDLAPEEGALVPLDAGGLPTGYPFDRYRLQTVLLPALEAKGFVVSLDRLIRLQHLLALLPANALAADLGDYLSPIFATNEQQQDQFHEVFAGIAAVFTRVETESPKREEPEPAVEPPTPPPPGGSGSPPPRSPEPSTPADGETQGPGGGGKPPLIPDLDQCTEPPFVWSIAPDKKIPLEPDAGFNRTLTRLRSRERTDLRSVDWPATVQASARMAGMPAIRYRHHTRPVEYLMLVERFAAEDHRALLFDRLWNILHEQEVLVERFFHDGDLRSCHNEQFPQGISLRDLRHRYASSRLLVLGSGYRMLSARTGKPADWTTALPDWPVRALLTPVTRQLWGLRERRLSDLFTLLPAAWESLRYLSEISEPDPHARFADLPADVRAVADWPPLTLESPFARNLRRHYEPELCRWIAACAVWPSLHFDLTLRLGRLLSTPENKLLTYDKLTRLARLDWFANGRIPRAARIELLEFLDARHPEILRQVSAYLLQLLEENKPENPKSVAFAEHQINIAILRVMLAEAPDPEQVRQLRTVLKRLDRDAELTDVVLTASVEEMLEKLGLVEVPPASLPPPEPEIKPDTQPESIEAGAVFAGRYLLEGQIGRGGIADVWKAYDREASRTVSLKIYRRTDAVGEKLARYEYEMTNHLRHPNINPVLDFGVAAQAPFLVFPYREINASHLIGQATEADLWKIIHDISSALAYLHGLNPPVVHGDLKPEHFLRTDEETWVLSDFGIAEEIEDSTERSLRNDPELLEWLKQRTILLHQVPPERQHPNLKVNSRTVDIWMFGAALYQIATGNPWMRPALEKGQAVLVSREFTIFPQEITKLISECLIWEREHRPKAVELLEIAKRRFEKETEKSPKIYISYRFADSLMQAGRLHQALEAELGQGAVFYDKDKLKPDMKWPNKLEEKVHTAEVVLVLIANPAKWLGVDDFGIRRMDNQDDWVRRELEGALSDSKKLVIPILLNDSQLPPERSLPDSIKPLLKRQHLQIKERYWDQDVRSLLNRLKDRFEGKPETILSHKVPPLKTFIIYARADTAYKNELLTHLRPLVELGLIETWHDAVLMPGEKWEKRIQQELDAAHLVLILVSADALGSDFIQTNELKAALQKKRMGNTQVVPILVRDCVWDLNADLLDLQMLPRDEKNGLLRSVANWESRDIAWARVCEDLKVLIEDLRTYLEKEKAEVARRVAEEAEKNWQKALPDMVFVQGGTFLMGEDSQYVAIKPRPAVQKSADIQSFHAYTCNRSAQYDKFQYALHGSENLHFFCLHGDERQLHWSFFKRIMYDLQGRYLNLLNSYSAKEWAVVTVDFEVDSSGASSPESLREIFLHNLYFALNIDPSKYHLLTQQNLQNLLLETEKTRNLHVGDYLCVFAHFRHRYWNPTLTPEVVQWFVQTFCAPQLPPNSPTVLFFFAFDFNEDENPGVRNEIFEFLNTGAKDMVVLPELTKVLKRDIGKWLVSWPDIFSPSTREQILSQYFPQNEYFMEEVEPILKKLIDDYFRSEDIEQDNSGGGVSVTISDFNIGKYPVTQKLWKEIMGANPSYFTGNDDCPVENASWDDVQDFLKKLNARFPGTNYRLPTEAEWEYAARGGKLSKGYAYSGSNDLGEVGWFSKNSGSKTHPIGIKKANELGLHDMSGNVWEWCADRYGDYPSSSQINPLGPSIGSDRVIRGGSWGGASEFCLVSYRHGSPSGYRGSNIGFRIASSIQSEDVPPAPLARARPIKK